MEANDNFSCSVVRYGKVNKFTDCQEFRKTRAGRNQSPEQFSTYCSWMKCEKPWGWKGEILVKQFKPFELQMSWRRKNCKNKQQGYFSPPLQKDEKVPDSTEKRQTGRVVGSSVDMYCTTISSLSHETRRQNVGKLLLGKLTVTDRFFLQMGIKATSYCVNTKEWNTKEWSLFWGISPHVLRKAGLVSMAPIQLQSMQRLPWVEKH